MNQRLNQIIQTLKEQRRIRSASDFAQIIGIDKAELSRIVNGKRLITQHFVGLISSHFPEINEKWLLDGEGDMLKNISVADNQAVALAGDDIKRNKINVNTDKTISMLVAELSAQRQLTEKVIDQNTDLIAIIAAMNKK